MIASKRTLIVRYHTLVAQTGMSEEDRRAMLFQWYGKTSSKQLTIGELTAINNFLAKNTSPKFNELDKARKRLIRAISKHCEAMGYNYNIKQIKSIAERAAKLMHSNGNPYSFNEIPLEKLRALYGSFSYADRALKGTLREVENLVTNKHKRIWKV